MKKSTLLLGALCLTTALNAADAPAAAAPTASAASGPYHLLKEIHIGGVASTDYLTVDPENHRLYVSHGAEVAVIDLDKDEVVGTITGLNGVHGIAIAPKAGLGYISNGRANNVSVFDLKTLKVTKTIPTDNNPDWIFYEPSQNEVYAFNGNSRTASVIDVAKGEVIATVELPGKPEASTADPKAGRVYNNIEDQAEVVAIDMKTHKIVATWKNAPAAGASGQALDAAHHRLFLACGDDTMTMMDSETGKVLFSLPAAKGEDSAAFDPGTGYAFVPGGQSGTVTVAKVDGDKLTLVQTLTTAQGAKTMALDPTTHKFYTATVKYEAPAASATPAAASGSATGARGRPARPNAVADSFRVLVYGLDAKK